jgi:hypothetical protein
MATWLVLVPFEAVSPSTSSGGLIVVMTASVSEFRLAQPPELSERTR